MRNEKELIAFEFDMSSRIDNNKDSTTTFLMSFDCWIDALWEDFDRSIAEMCFHIIADGCSRLLAIAELELFISQRSRSLKSVSI